MWCNSAHLEAYTQQGLVRDLNENIIGRSRRIDDRLWGGLVVGV
jgi:hypothetical protein